MAYISLIFYNSFQALLFKDKTQHFLLFIYFRTIVHCARFIHRLENIRKIPELMPMGRVRKIPYELRPLRKTIDTSTFTLYSHWVKKGEGMGQNRAALFQHSPRVAERAASLDVINPNLLDIPKESKKQILNLTV